MLDSALPQARRACPADAPLTSAGSRSSLLWEATVLRAPSTDQLVSRSGEHQLQSQYRPCQMLSYGSWVRLVSLLEPWFRRWLPGVVVSIQFLTQRLVHSPHTLLDE